jgi:DHA2 family multidrug resistance protein
MNSQTDSSGGTGTERWRPKANPWLIALAVAMAAFMEVLDTSIANARCPTWPAT